MVTELHGANIKSYNSTMDIQEIENIKELVLAKFPRKKFKKGDFIFKSGDEIGHFYYITNGRLRLSQSISKDKEITHNILTNGEFFGEEVFFDESVTLYNAYVCGDSEIIEVPYQELARIPGTSKFIIHLMANKLKAYKARLSTIANKDSKSRIIDFIENLIQSKGKQVGFEYVVYDFMTHNDIAGITATSRQTVTTVLNDLKKQNIITFNRRRLIVRDLDKMLNL